MSNRQNINIEKEVKFKIHSRVTGSELDKFLVKLGLTIKRREQQEDVYWDNKDCEITNLKRGLRIRYISNTVADVEFKSLFKGDNGQYVVEEIELLKNGVLDTSAIKNILADRLEICRAKDIKGSNLNSPEANFLNLGLLPVITLKKERRVWSDTAGEVEVSVDTISDIGVFVEIEQVDCQSQIYDHIVEKFEKSGFTTRDIAYGGYLDLLISRNDKITPAVEFEKKFAEDNRWNVKFGEQNIFLTLTRL